MTTITQRANKQKILDSIDHNNNPQNWRLINLINDKSISIKRLLKDMERQNLISIQFITEPSGRVRRVLTKKVNNINEIYD